MVAANRIFDGLTLREKEVWHDMTCQGKITPESRALVAKFKQEFESAITGLN